MGGGNGYNYMYNDRFLVDCSIWGRHIIDQAVLTQIDLFGIPNVSIDITYV